MKAIEGKRLKDMILGAAAILEKNKDALDALNVFPVPDGDTGTNMSLTMITAAKEVASLDEDALDVKHVMQALSLGALKGARGNSGVILSRIFAGVADAVTQADRDMDTALTAEAFGRGVEFAYKAVMKPKEGTILTVARTVAEAAALVAKRSDDLYKQLLYMIREGEKTLKQTPDMLPVLKEAGVVDAGGAGYLVILMGFKSVIVGENIETKDLFGDEAAVDFTAVAGGGEEIEFGYCTEFFIKNLFPETQQRDIDTFRNNLAKIGDCVLVVGDIGLVKTHVHTNEPGLALQYAQALGELSKIKVDNMREQHRHIHEEAEEPAARDKKELAVIAVTSGEGLRSIFADWQVDGFVEGGQSMNPSTDDILKAIEAMHAKNIMILPNNQNIILAAEQAADLCEENVVVIKTKSEPQGIAAAVAYDPERLIDENTERMNKAICTVRTGQITNAVRDTKMNGSKIKEGEVIGIADGKIVANGAAIENIAVELIEALTDEDSEIVTFYYGGQVEEPAAEKLFSHVRERFGNFDFELVYGGQPVYQYLISVE